MAPVRIIGHWTAGTYNVTGTDKEHYHEIIDGNGGLHKGFHTIEDNEDVSDDDYAGHTAGTNTKAIGLACACMMGAVESPFNAGAYPLKKIQFDKLVERTAFYCKKYGIKVTPQTVLFHSEVEKNLGNKQKGKWDMTRLPFSPISGAKAVGDYYRAQVQKRL